MKTYTMLEVAIEVAWQIGDSLEDSPRAESRWFVADVVQDLLNLDLIDDTTEDLDEIVASYLTNRGIKS